MSMAKSQRCLLDSGRRMINVDHYEIASPTYAP